ncbi:uncharacterized protein LOC126568616 isoform X1 [Anopheles maculipalpis]|uniref:uncharacterized protein LOC126568616 isoform X1 n=1 Tax=Anopheles maculipalpis TaxID=1496333 RepID=UPI002158EF0A|nr:uncharacterized protein LOC126568616 isoform X1 [Anopheles maculipalpis]
MEFKLLVWKVGLLCIFSQHPVVQAQIAPSCSEYVKQYYANPSTYYTTGTVYCGGWQRREVSYQCPKTTCSGRTETPSAFYSRITTPPVECANYRLFSLVQQTKSVVLDT